MSDALTIVLENNDGRGRTWGYVVRDDGTIDTESSVTQIEPGDLDEAFGDFDECPKCDAPLDGDDCSECGATSEEIHESGRPRCEHCEKPVYVGDWDALDSYYCSDCVTILEGTPAPQY